MTDRAAEPVTAERRSAAVDHLAVLLERDLVTLEAFQPLVDRVLAAETVGELGTILSDLPATVAASPGRHPAEESITYRCDGGVMKLNTPFQLAPMTELRCDGGVMKVDLSFAELDDEEIDLDLVVNRGVMAVIVPRGLAFRVTEVSGGRGVFKNRLRSTPGRPGEPRVLIRVQNDGGVLKLRHPWRGRFSRRP